MFSINAFNLTFEVLYIMAPINLSDLISSPCLVLTLILTEPLCWKFQGALLISTLVWYGVVQCRGYGKKASHTLFPLSSCLLRTSPFFCFILVFIFSFIFSNYAQCTLFWEDLSHLPPAQRSGARYCLNHSLALTLHPTLVSVWPFFICLIYFWD